MQGGQVKLKRKMLKVLKKSIAVLAISGIILSSYEKEVCAKSETDEIVLRVCNWEEYMDLGGWDKDEVISLDNGVEIQGINPMYDDFADWYFQTYGKRVRVEYSCFGTNEDLYNQLNLGDTYDLVCPSEYMIMKLMTEGRLEPYSEEFFNKNNEYNYYINNVSPYILKMLQDNEGLSKYAAGYMWGITGVLYNPEKVTPDEAATWKIFENDKFRRQVTLKDNVRDSYFAALGMLKSDILSDEQFVNSEDYTKRLADEMNDVSQETIYQAQELLDSLMNNIYSLETDSGKADMITGKIVANYQWSGDAVYAMKQAEEDNFELKFAVPRESTNLWFDGWVMLKSGINGNPEQKHAAEAFVNFVSRPDNAVRNMHYVGYTSSIAGNAENTTVFDYVKWCYGADDSDKDIMRYPIGYFFSGNDNDEAYMITASVNQMGSQLYAQYPTGDVMKRTAVMRCFDEDAGKAINKMWINVRCFDIYDVPVVIWLAVLLLVLVLLGKAYCKSKK